MNHDLHAIKRLSPLVQVAEMLGLRVAPSGGRIRATKARQQRRCRCAVRHPTDGYRGLIPEIRFGERTVRYPLAECLQVLRDGASNN